MSRISPLRTGSRRCRSPSTASSPATPPTARVVPADRCALSEETGELPGRTSTKISGAWLASSKRNSTEHRSIVDWHENLDVQRELRRDLKRQLRETGRYEEGDLDELVRQVVEVARAPHPV